MKLKFIPFYLLSAIWLVFVATSWDQFKISAPRAKISEESLAFPEEEKVIVTSKAYSQEDSEQVLQNGLLHLGIQPIQVTIQNQSAHLLLLSEKSVDVPLMDTDEVVKKIYRDSMARSVGLKLMGFVFWPFSVASTVDSIITYESKEKTKHNFLAKSLKRSDEIIPAYSAIHRLFFIKTDQLKKGIDLSITNKEKSSTMHFHLDLSKAVSLASSAEELVDNSPLAYLTRLRTT